MERQDREIFIWCILLFSLCMVAFGASRYTLHNEAIHSYDATITKVQFPSSIPVIDYVVVTYNIYVEVSIKAQNTTIKRDFTDSCTTAKPNNCIQKFEVGQKITVYGNSNPDKIIHTKPSPAKYEAIVVCFAFVMAACILRLIKFYHHN